MKFIATTRQDMNAALVVENAEIISREKRKKKRMLPCCGKTKKETHQ